MNTYTEDVLLLNENIDNERRNYIQEYKTLQKTKEYAEKHYHD